tara:strand:- start:463 stop:624 length:162 start_codon:yes stop_codon:yes gene_type:complete
MEMKMAKSNGWAPKSGLGKKTTIGHGKRSKYKAKGSNNTVPKGYRKKYRGQGK